MSENYGKHFYLNNWKLTQNGVMVELTANIKAQVVKTTDQAIVAACVEFAKNVGITDLYLIDEDFVNNALKKQIPMAPYRNYIDVGDSPELFHCPACHYQDGCDLEDVYDRKYKFCPMCGQKLKWGDEDGKL